VGWGGAGCGREKGPEKPWQTLNGIEERVVEAMGGRGKEEKHGPKGLDEGDDFGGGGDRRDKRARTEGPSEERFLKTKRPEPMRRILGLPAPKKMGCRRCRKSEGR